MKHKTTRPIRYNATQAEMDAAVAENLAQRIVHRERALLFSSEPVRRAISAAVSNQASEVHIEEDGTCVLGLLGGGKPAQLLTLAPEFAKREQALSKALRACYVSTSLRFGAELRRVA